MDALNFQNIITAASVTGVLIWCGKVWIASVNKSIKSLEDKIIELNLSHMKSNSERKSDIAVLETEMKQIKTQVRNLESEESKGWEKVFNHMKTRES